MKPNRYILYITYFLVLCGISRGLPILSSIPLSMIKLFLILISIVCLFSYFEIVREKIITCLLLFLLYQSIAYVLKTEPNATYYSNTLATMMAVVPFFCFSKFGLISQKNLSVFIILALFIICYSFEYSKNMIIFDRNSENVTTNYGYFFATIMPFVFLLKKDWIKAIVVIVSIIGAVYSVKRGAIVITVLIGLYFFYITLRSYGKNVKIKYIVVASVIFVVASMYIYALMKSSDSFLYRLEMTLEGDSNGRDDIIYQSLDYLSRENVINLLFGNGYFSTVNIFGIEAHNDWIESLIDYGIFGTLPYLLFIIYMYKCCKNAITKNHKIALLSVLFVWFFKSIFSMQYYNFNSILMTIVLGITLGDQQKENENSLFN